MPSAKIRAAGQAGGSGELPPLSMLRSIPHGQGTEGAFVHGLSSAEREFASEEQDAA